MASALPSAPAAPAARADIGQSITFKFSSELSLVCSTRPDATRNEIVLVNAEQTAPLRVNCNKEFEAFSDFWLSHRPESPQVSDSEKKKTPPISDINKTYKIGIQVDKHSDSRVINWVFPNGGRITHHRAYHGAKSKTLIKHNGKETEVNIRDNETKEKFESLLKNPLTFVLPELNEDEMFPFPFFIRWSVPIVKVTYVKHEAAILKSQLVKGGISFIKKFFDVPFINVDRFFGELGFDVETHFTGRRTPPLDEKAAEAFTFLFRDMKITGNNKSLIEFREKVVAACSRLRREEIKKEVVEQYFNIRR